VGGGGGAGRPAGEQVRHEGLEVGPGGGLQAGATLTQDVGLPHGDQIGGDGAGEAVLGIEVSLEGADEPVAAEGVHEQEG
jgi:hypothetical protein